MTSFDRLMGACSMTREARSLLGEAAGLSTGIDLGLQLLDEALHELKELQETAAAAAASRLRNGGAVGKLGDLARRCPQCGHELQVRYRGSDGESFWGCSQFPGCRFTVPISLAEARRLSLREGRG